MSHRMLERAARNQVPRGIKSAIETLKRAQANENLSKRIQEAQLAAQRSGFPASEGELARDPLGLKIQIEIERLEKLFEENF
jgi:hypothetical protein